MPRVQIGSIVATAVSLAASASMAQTGPKLSTIIAGLEDKGFTVTEVDVDRTEIEVEVIAADGKRFDIDINPADGSILRETPKN